MRFNRLLVPTQKGQAGKRGLISAAFLQPAVTRFSDIVISESHWRLQRLFSVEPLRAVKDRDTSAACAFMTPTFVALMPKKLVSLWEDQGNKNPIHTG